MEKHFINSHSGEEERPQFGMRVVRYHTSAVHRQIHEACLIWQRARQKRVTVLNSKSMFNKCSLKKLVLEDSNYRFLYIKLSYDTIGIAVDTKIACSDFF